MNNLFDQYFDPDLFAEEGKEAERAESEEYLDVSKLKPLIREKLFEKPSTCIVYCNIGNYSRKNFTLVTLFKNGWLTEYEDKKIVQRLNLKRTVKTVLETKSPTQLFCITNKEIKMINFTDKKASCKTLQIKGFEDSELTFDQTEEAILVTNKRNTHSLLVFASSQKKPLSFNLQGLFASIGKVKIKHLRKPTETLLLNLFVFGTSVNKQTELAELSVTFSNKTTNIQITKRFNTEPKTFLRAAEIGLLLNKRALVENSLFGAYLTYPVLVAFIPISTGSVVYGFKMKVISFPSLKQPYKTKLLLRLIKTPKITSQFCLEKKGMPITLFVVSKKLLVSYNQKTKTVEVLGSFKNEITLLKSTVKEDFSLFIETEGIQCFEIELAEKTKSKENPAFFTQLKKLINKPVKLRKEFEGKLVLKERLFATAISTEEKHLLYKNKVLAVNEPHLIPKSSFIVREASRTRNKIRFIKRLLVVRKKFPFVFFRTEREHVSECILEELLPNEKNFYRTELESVDSSKELFLRLFTDGKILIVSKEGEKENVLFYNEFAVAAGERTLHTESLLDQDAIRKEADKEIGSRIVTKLFYHYVLGTDKHFLFLLKNNKVAVYKLKVSPTNIKITEFLKFESETIDLKRSIQNELSVCINDKVVLDMVLQTESKLGVVLYTNSQLLKTLIDNAEVLEISTHSNKLKSLDSETPADSFVDIFEYVFKNNFHLLNRFPCARPISNKNEEFLNNYKVVSHNVESFLHFGFVEYLGVVWVTKKLVSQRMAVSFSAKESGEKIFKSLDMLLPCEKRVSAVSVVYFKHCEKPNFVFDTSTKKKEDAERRIYFLCITVVGKFGSLLYLPLEELKTILKRYKNEKVVELKTPEKITHNFESINMRYQGFRNHTVFSFNFFFPISLTLGFNGYQLVVVRSKLFLVAASLVDSTSLHAKSFVDLETPIKQVKAIEELLLVRTNERLFLLSFEMNSFSANVWKSYSCENTSFVNFCVKTITTKSYTEQGLEKNEILLGVLSFEVDKMEYFEIELENYLVKHRCVTNTAEKINKVNDLGLKGALSALVEFEDGSSKVVWVEERSILVQ